MNIMRFPQTQCFLYAEFHKLPYFEYVRDTVAVLDSLVVLFKRYFSTIAQTPLYIVNGHPKHSEPETFCGSKVIFLKVSPPEDGSGGYWTQFIYQFSHEFCHHLIPRPVPKKLRWFEESLCELASHFFLLKSAEMWAIAPPYESWRPFAPAVLSYEINAQKTASFFPISDLLRPGSEILMFLERNEYQRDFNKNVALKLLPFFIDNPCLWNIIYALPDLSPDSTFKENMITLQRKTPHPIYDIICSLP